MSASGGVVTTADPYVLLPSGRPGMRRKSSAQNLLLFKQQNQQSQQLGAGGGGSGMIPSSSSSSVIGGTIDRSAATTPTPTSSTLVSREWDSQSAHSDGIPPTSVDGLRETMYKRMVTLTFIRDLHHKDGRSHWFSTIAMSRSELGKVFTNTAMKKRTYRYAILGMSLSALLDPQAALGQSPQNFLRGLQGVLSEFEQAKDEDYKPRMRLFRSKPKKGQGGEFPIAYHEADTTYLTTPHMPFQLDYQETLLTLVDVISEIYFRIYKLLGSSHQGQVHLTHTLGGPLMCAPLPGLSYLFDGNEVPEPGSLLSLISDTSTSEKSRTREDRSGSDASYPALGQPKEITDLVTKIDSKFKKILNALVKDLDAFARNGIKDELATLDPLLRNVAVSDNVREQYDFE